MQWCSIISLIIELACKSLNVISKICNDNKHMDDDNTNDNSNDQAIRIYNTTPYTSRNIILSNMKISYNKRNITVIHHCHCHYLNHFLFTNSIPWSTHYSTNPPNVYPSLPNPSWARVERGMYQWLVRDQAAVDERATVGPSARTSGFTANSSPHLPPAEERDFRSVYFQRWGCCFHIFLLLLL